MRSLSETYRGGGEQAFRAFEELAQLMLSLTVMSQGQAVRLSSSPDAPLRRVLGGQRGPTSPVQLRDGRWLRVAVTLYLDPDADKRLKVSKSSFQYQADEAGLQEICRYDYLRQAGTDPHPQAHLNVHGTLQHAPALVGGKPLARIHFPTNRVSLEAVIRMLAEQFGVPTNRPSSVWRPVLAASEAPFSEIAHRPLSGPVE